MSQLLQEKFGYTKAQADRLAYSACLANSTYILLDKSGADVGSEEDFYRRHLGKEINSRTAYLEKSSGYIASLYGKQQVTIRDYFQINRLDFEYAKVTYQKWSNRKGKYINHTLTVNKNNNEIRIFYDTGQQRSLTNGHLFHRIVAPDRFVYLQYIK